jgi:hypothetical protein
MFDDDDDEVQEHPLFLSKIQKLKFSHDLIKIMCVKSKIVLLILTTSQKILQKNVYGVSLDETMIEIPMKNVILDMLIIDFETLE